MLSNKVNFVGCELDKHYYDLALERFNNETQQRDILSVL